MKYLLVYQGMGCVLWEFFHQTVEELGPQLDIQSRLNFFD